MNIFVFEMVMHIEYQIKLLTDGIKAAKKDKEQNIYKKERNRFNSILLSLKTIKHMDTKFTTKHTKVTEFIFSREFSDQLEIMLKSDGKR